MEAAGTEKGLRLCNRARAYIAAPRRATQTSLISLLLQPPFSVCSPLSLYSYHSSHERAEPQHFWCVLVLACGGASRLSIAPLTNHPVPAYRSLRRRGRPSWQHPGRRVSVELHSYPYPAAERPQDPDDASGPPQRFVAAPI